MPPRHINIKNRSEASYVSHVPRHALLQTMACLVPEYSCSSDTIQ